MELVRFRRGEVDLINSLDPETFDQLASQSPALGGGRRALRSNRR